LGVGIDAPRRASILLDETKEGYMLKIFGVEFDEKNMAAIFGVESPDGVRTGFAFYAADIVRVLPILQEIALRVKDAHAKAHPGIVFSAPVPMKEFEVSASSAGPPAESLSVSFISPDKVQGHFLLDRRQAKKLAEMILESLEGGSASSPRQH
jgi:hypothetical protein